MRALAVGAVLVYHLWPNRLPGGFVGVDVFFVISGFLIGGHLVTELAATGRIRLGRFWARRALRLLPASLLVLFVVTVATLVIAPLGVRDGFLKEVVGSVFYVQNWVLAHEAVDYLASSEAVSPVQHYWSLSVEEQLYVALPLVLTVVALLARATGWAGVRLTVVVIAVLAGLSLTWSVLSTPTDPALAYFSTGTRAWEFLLGALLACVSREIGRGPRAVLGTVGLALTAASMFVLSDGSVFPGALALLPVLGAVLLLSAGDAGPVARASRWRPVTWLGDVSYAVYLWHWPLVVLVPFVTGTPLTTLHKVLIVLATLVLGWLSTTYVELPVRTSPRLLRAPRRDLVIAGAAIAASVVVAGSANLGRQASVQEQERAIAAAETLLASDEGRCLGAASLDPTLTGCPDLGDVLVPPPSTVALDTYNRKGCWATFGVAELQLCSYGSEAAQAPRVLAVGDSHSNGFLAAYEPIADELGWRLDVAGRAGCSWGTRPQGGRSAAIAEECARWKSELADHLAAGEPYDLILTTSDVNGYLAVPEPGEKPRQATIAGLTEAWSSQVERGTAVVVLRDFPRAMEGVVECVELHADQAASRCSSTRAAVAPRFDAARRAAQETRGTAIVDIRDLICPRDTCLPVIGNVVVYRNPEHLTATFVRTLTPYLKERILRAAGKARADLPALSAAGRSVTPRPVD